jgi:hypothetical protein
MALGVGAIVKSVAGLGQTWLEGKVAKTKAKAEAEAAVMVKQAESVADWETAMARSSQQSWKDEWLTILFSIPVLQNMPEWYHYALSVIVAASFGVRSVIGIMNKKK